MYDWILLQCMAFNVIAVIFGFLLTPLALFFEHHQVHSNSHIGLTHLNVFGSYVGLVKQFYYYYFIKSEYDLVRVGWP